MGQGAADEAHVRRAPGLALPEADGGYISADLRSRIPRARVELVRTQASAGICSGNEEGLVPDPPVLAQACLGELDGMFVPCGYGAVNQVAGVRVVRFNEYVAGWSRVRGVYRSACLPGVTHRRAL
jgi:hypothetical protein